MRFAFAILSLWAALAVPEPSHVRRFWSALDQTRHSYWMPMTHGMVDQVVPVKPIEAPRQVLIWNQFDEGHYGARVFEFEELGNTGKFKRLPARRVYTLAGFLQPHSGELGYETNRQHLVSRHGRN